MSKRCESCEHFRLVKDFKVHSALNSTDATCVHPTNFRNIVYLTTADGACERHEEKNGRQV